MITEMSATRLMVEATKRPAGPEQKAASKIPSRYGARICRVAVGGDCLPWLFRWTTSGEQAARSNVIAPLNPTLVQKRFETFACVMTFSRDRLFACDIRRNL